MQDFRHGARLLLRSPGVSAAAILTLAVAIAGNTAIFSVANALLFKPVPVAAPQELARVRAGQSQMSWPAYQDFRERTGVFAALAAHRRLRVGLSANAALPVRLQAEQTSLNYFDTLRVPATHGRTYGPGEPRRNVVVLAEHVWRVRFGSDRGERDHRGRARGVPRRGTGGRRTRRQRVAHVARRTREPSGGAARRVTRRPTTLRARRPTGSHGSRGVRADRQPARPRYRARAVRR